MARAIIMVDSATISRSQAVIVVYSNQLKTSTPPASQPHARHGLRKRDIGCDGSYTPACAVTTSGL